jgi:hypothetical protein
MLLNPVSKETYYSVKRDLLQYLALLVAHVVEPKALAILLRDTLGLPEIDVT